MKSIKFDLVYVKYILTKINDRQQSEALYTC